MPEMSWDDIIDNLETAAKGKDVRASLVDIAQKTQTAVENQILQKDDTLTETNMAAGAKAVGDVIYRSRDRATNTADVWVQFTGVSSAESLLDMPVQSWFYCAGSKLKQLCGNDFPYAYLINDSYRYYVTRKYRAGSAEVSVWDIYIIYGTLHLTGCNSQSAFSTITWKDITNRENDPKDYSSGLTLFTMPFRSWYILTKANLTAVLSDSNVTCPYLSDLPTGVSYILKREFSVPQSSSVWTVCTMSGTLGIWGYNSSNDLTNVRWNIMWWEDKLLGNKFQNSKILPNGSNIDTDIGDNETVLLISTNNYDGDLPFGIGTIINIKTSATLSVQIGFQFTTGELFYRRKSTTWGTWRSLSDSLKNYRTGGKYVAFGDSLSYGAVWSPTQGQTIHQVKEEWRIPTRIAIATGMEKNFVNEAIGGIGYLKEVNSQNLVQQIAAYTFTNVELVTIMAGANDKSTKALGTASDASSANTICGAIRNIIQTIATKNPKTQIVIIQPTPSGVDGNSQDVWSTIPSGWKWSLNQFDEQVSQLCANEHVAYINWNDSTYCRNWKNVGYYEQNGPNYTHPTADEDYYMLGSFIAGKVAAKYKGLA